jgi:ketosteroid isomerase-like protein
MSLENVESAERTLDAFNRRDVDALMADSCADVEWVPAMGAIEGEVFRGRDGIEMYWGRLDEAWEEYRLLADEYRDLGDRVLGLGRRVARGRASGVQVDTQFGVLDDFRDGRISSIRGSSITARRCRRRACRGQVPVSGVRPRSAPDTSASVRMRASRRTWPRLLRWTTTARPRSDAPDARFAPAKAAA